ncbi:hypothetical protein [uncultured Sphaerochaeta sp.]|uniref:hypothetical protein n=1 Tax=uncultured Sphaerochaeta sp. TaxID=886478 RepID=UPI002A0A3428|nr:hypothetical protein [uncultured Sphaerochaeta sp.]
MKIEKKALHVALLFFLIGLLCTWYLSYRLSTVAADLGVEVSLPLTSTGNLHPGSLGVYTSPQTPTCPKVRPAPPFEKTITGKAIILGLLIF